MTDGFKHTRLHLGDQISLKELRSLDRNKTVILIPVGMLELHGDHLPFGTDNYAVDALLHAASAWMLENDPDLHVLMMPGIPYGTDPVDDRRPDLFQTNGSVWISRDTLKAIVSDLSQQLIRYGFKAIFPVTFHGGPDQCVALDEICAELRKAHPGLIMYEPGGYVLAGAEKEMAPGVATLLGRQLTSKEEISLKGSIHASMFETSLMLHLRPDLVDPLYKSLRTIEWRDMFQMSDWPGYVGSGPAHADAELGGAVLRWRGVRVGSLILKALAGEDLSQRQRHPKWLDEDPGNLDLEQLPAAPSEPFIDTKPEMFIPSEKLQAVAKHEPEDPNTTPSSSLMETKPRVSRLPDSIKPDTRPED